MIRNTSTAVSARTTSSDTADTRSPPGPEAHWYDGRSARPQAVRVRIEHQQLVLHHADGSSHGHPLRALRWPEPSRHGARQMGLPDGSLLRADDPAAWDRWIQLQGLRPSWAARWSSQWSYTACAGLLLAGLLWAAVGWGIPVAARHLAQSMPEAATQAIDRVTLAELTRRGWLKPSGLAPAEQQRIRDAVAALVRAAYPDNSSAPPLRYDLRFHQLPAFMGPNAFALPGGVIVLGDELVALLHSQQPTGTATAVEPALLGVVAHELGHVRQQHGLQLVAQAGAISVLVGWWVGDYAMLLSTVPTLLIQARFSRDHERAADRESAHAMRVAGLNPAAMADFLRLLQKAKPGSAADNTAFGLSTHPADNERIAFFERAAAER